MAAIVAGLLALSLFLGPLIARVMLDRRRERADVIAADVRAAIWRRLGGESMISVEVQAAGLWTPARILLSAPRGYQDLIEKVWPAVALRVPPGYEVVVRAAAIPAASTKGEPLPRAA